MNLCQGGLQAMKVGASGPASTRPEGFFRAWRQSGRSSGVEHNLAKVGVEGSNPFARSSFPSENNGLGRCCPRLANKL